MWYKDCAVEFLVYYVPKSGLTIHLDICIPLKLNSDVFKKRSNIFLIYTYTYKSLKIIYFVRCLLLKYVTIDLFETRKGIRLAAAAVISFIIIIIIIF